MASKERWDFAQVYSGLEMSKRGLWMVSIGLLGMFIPIPDWAGTYAGIAVLFIVLGIMFYRVESKMKKRYPL